MFGIHCLFICFVLIAFHACAGEVRFLSPGDRVELPCNCPTDQACRVEHLRWIRFTPNRQMEIMNIGNKTNNPRYSVRDNVFTITETNSSDSGRYYCVEHSYSYLSFKDNGTVLQVGDAWTEESKLLLMKEEYGNLTEKAARLQCVATGLATPWVNVSWHVSGMHGEAAFFGQSWSFTEPSGRYCVISERVVPPWLLRQLTADVGAPLDDEVQDETGVWWCELQTGMNRSVRSPVFGHQPDTGWCIPLTATLSALCVLFASFASISCFNVLHRSPGSVPEETSASPSHDSERDVYTGVTYCHLDLKKAPKSRNRHAEKGRARDEDRLVYSEVRYNCEAQEHCQGKFKQGYAS